MLASVLSLLWIAKCSRIISCLRRHHDPPATSMKRAAAVAAATAIEGECEPDELRLRPAAWEALAAVVVGKSSRKMYKKCH